MLCHAHGVYTHDAFPVSCRIEIQLALSNQLYHLPLTFLTSCLDCAGILSPAGGEVVVFFVFCRVCIQGEWKLMHMLSVVLFLGKSQSKMLYSLLCCFVVGSRWLVPPDALQPKAYCTNPGF